MNVLGDDQHSTERTHDVTKVLILGATGMLGHKLLQVLSGRYDVFGSVRRFVDECPVIPGVDIDRIVGEVDAERPETVRVAIDELRPEVVINCIGIIKQLDEAKNAEPNIRINALWPHQLARMCGEYGSRMIHISTDCVFSGCTGMYTEASESDATDLYGRSKFLGEVDSGNCLTVRTSVIGHELNSSYGLIEWFLSNRGKRVKGFRHAIYSGFPTVMLAGILGDVIAEHADLHGVWQVSSDPINKYDLLKLVRDLYDVDVEIEPDDDFRIDRSLDSGRFREETGFRPPSWPEMIKAMREDAVAYEHWK